MVSLKNREIKNEMDSISKAGIWLNRGVLLFVSVLFTIIGFKNMLHPVENAMLSNIMLGSAKALSIARVGLGAFPFAIAIILFTFLFSIQDLFRGILSVFILIVIITIVRIISFKIDGAAPFIGPEIVVTILSGTGLYLELRRRRNAH